MIMDGVQEIIQTMLGVVSTQMKIRIIITINQGVMLGALLLKIKMRQIIIKNGVVITIHLRIIITPN